MLGHASEATERRRTRLAEHRRLSPHVPAIRTSAFRRAVEWLYPWTEYTYPGFRRGAATVACSSLDMVKHWLSGKRVMPEAVRIRLVEAIKARLEHGHAVLAELEAMQTTKPESPVVRIQRARARRREAEKQL